MRAKIIAVDFDGTLIEEGKWPGIGATNEKVLDYCKSEQAKGARIILWTNRVGEPLEAAVKWCENNGLRLDAVNENLQESIDFFGFNTRKIYADEFIDDRMAKGFDLPHVTEAEQRLEALPQYHIDRDVMCKIVAETVGYERLMDAFDHGTVICDSFAWFRNSDEFYIIHLDSGMMVNWYKHLGRTNTCSQANRTVEDYRTFFTLFKEELDYWGEGVGKCASSATVTSITARNAERPIQFSLVRVVILEFVPSISTAASSYSRITTSPVDILTSTTVLSAGERLLRRNL